MAPLLGCPQERVDWSQRRGWGATSQLCGDCVSGPHCSCAHQPRPPPVHPTLTVCACQAILPTVNSARVPSSLQQCGCSLTEVSLYLLDISYSFSAWKLKFNVNKSKYGCLRHISYFIVNRIVFFVSLLLKVLA